MAETIRIEGLAALGRTLAQLPARLEQKIIMGALRAAGQVIRKDAMARVPILSKPDPRRRPGTVKRNIVVRKTQFKKNSVYVGVASISKKKLAAYKAGGKKAANNPNDPYYWIFLEYGTSKMAARPFLRPAFEAKKYDAVKAFEQYLRKRLGEEVQKLAREMGMRAA